MLPITDAEAAQLRFAPSAPSQNTLYVGHPRAPMLYYTAAGFHRMLLEHKFLEAIRLLTSLGASDVTVEHVEDQSEEFSAEASASAPQGGGSASAGANTAQSSNFFYNAKFTGVKTPSVPSDMVWYPHEQTWQQMAAARLERDDLHHYTLRVVHADDFGVNASLEGSAKAAGLKLGGSMENHCKTTWKFEVTFAASSA